jgi:hypothetical protein
VDTTLHYAEGRPPDSDDRPAPAPASATNLSLKVAPASRIPPSAAAFSLASLPAHLATLIAVDPQTLEWIWTGRLDRDGYGRIGNRGVHREVYQLLVGPIPPGREIDHVRRWGCTSRACCSPWHLEPVTSRENCMRGTSFAAVNAAKTECIHGHPFDLFGTYWRPNGHRDCRACIRDRVKRYQRRKRYRAKAGAIQLPDTEFGRAA